MPCSSTSFSRSTRTRPRRTRLHSHEARPLIEAQPGCGGARLDPHPRDARALRAHRRVGDDRGPHAGLQELTRVPPLARAAPPLLRHAAERRARNKRLTRHYRDAVVERGVTGTAPGAGDAGKLDHANNAIPVPCKGFQQLEHPLVGPVHVAGEGIDDLLCRRERRRPRQRRDRRTRAAVPRRRSTPRRPAVNAARRRPRDQVAVQRPLEARQRGTLRRRSCANAPGPTRA